MFTSLEVTRFGCVENVRVRLSALHAFIGPNDAGKSTLLRAVQWCCWPHGVEGRAEPRRDVFPRLPSYLRPGAKVTLGLHDGEVSTSFVNGDLAPSPGRRYVPMPMLLRLDPDALRSNATVIPDGAPLMFVDERGTGLAAIYDALQNRDFDAFVAIRKRVLELFPSVRQIGFPGSPAHANQRTVTITLADQTVVGAHAVSEGLLYFLALAALPHVEAGSAVLLEEPENGLHPARIAEVMRVLREISLVTQVLIATHSPLVINELHPNEVSVVTRDEHGTRVTPIADTANFAERFQTFALGELWLAYANGRDEASLLTGKPVL